MKVPQVSIDNIALPLQFIRQFRLMIIKEFRIRDNYYGNVDAHCI